MRDCVRRGFVIGVASLVLALASAWGQASLSWEAPVAYERVTVIVAGHSGIVFRKDFGRSATPWFDLTDSEGNLLADGTYQYELRWFRAIPDEAWNALWAAKEAGDYAALVELEQQYAPLVVRESGSFVIDGGRLRQDEGEGVRR